MRLVCLGGIEMRRALSTRASLAGAVVLAMGILAPSVAFADARTEARSHFKKGMVGIASGKYEQGIDELKKAYEVLPNRTSSSTSRAPMSRWATSKMQFSITSNT